MSIKKQIYHPWLRKSLHIRSIQRKFCILYENSKDLQPGIITKEVKMEAELMETESGHESSRNSQAPMLEIGDQPSREFLELFAKLDSTIGGDLIEKAWKQYDTIGQQIVLEGNQSVWMACAFFTSVWKTTPFGHQELICRFSLSKLLELCQVSVLDFFDKLNKWADMIVSSRRLLDHVSRIQSNLAVSAVIFKKFLPIFRHIFTNVVTTTSSTNQKQQHTPYTRQHLRSPQKRLQHEQRQKQNLQITTAQLFEFCWIAFIALKKQHLQEDLLNSFHLLLCVLDYIYVAVEQAGMCDHINPSFTQKLLLDKQTPLEYLCQEFDGIILDAKHLRIHWFLPTLSQLSNDGIIVGKEHENIAGILLNIEENRNAFMNLYEQRMLVRSEIDERIFLKPSLLANIDMVFDDTLNEIAVMVLREFGDNNSNQLKLLDTDLLIKVSTQNCLEKLGVNQPLGYTPITGKSYVITPETVCPNTVISTEVKQYERLEQLLTGSRDGDNLLAFIFEECQDNPRDYISQQLISFTQKFMSKMDEEIIQNGPDYDSDFDKELTKRISDIESLFFLLLQKVVTYDRERAISMGIETTIDLGAIFQSVEFLVSVYICALDVVLWAYGSKRIFPWSVELFKTVVTPLNFYRIIELIVRADTGLSREAIKHLNQMEESVLDELAWQPDSPIWRCLENSQAVGRFNEISAVPSSQILARNYAQLQRHADLGQPIITFFKKVYHLAVIRITDLCERLRITEELSKQKIWTLFEHIFRTQTTMLRGRHMDQLLMCIVYIIAKVCHLGTSFQDIIYHYRHQPQSVGRVYRQVLIDNIYNSTNSPNEKATPSTQMSESQQQTEYADLIKFYNRVFVSSVEDFVKLLHPSGSDSKENLVPLSPMPRVPLNPLSPRKLINDQINVVPMSQYTQSTTSGRTIRRYDFHKSPSKDLRSINAMVRGTTMHGPMSSGSNLGVPMRYGLIGGTTNQQYYQAPPNNSTIY